MNRQGIFHGMRGMGEGGSLLPSNAGEGVVAARIVPAVIMALPAGAALQAQALHVLSHSPQDALSEVRQVFARFDKAAVSFGVRQAAACSSCTAAMRQGA
jgi:hypothetical protein